MASVKYGVIVTEIKGKSGGQVFQAGKQGFTIKNKPSKNNVKQAAPLYGTKSTQVLWFGCMANGIGVEPCEIEEDGSHKADDESLIQTRLMAMLAGSWRGLDPAQRDAWNAAAPSFPFHNKFGDSYTASGYQVYCSLNLNLSKINEPLVPWPPAPGAPAIPNFILLDPALPNIMPITFPDGIPAGVKVQISASPIVSFGKTQSKPPVKLIGVISECLPGTTFELVYTWSNFFGLFIGYTGIIWFNVKATNTATGVTAN